MNNGKTILVTGATGQQGGATVRHLLDQGWRVRGLTRSAESAKASALAESGVEVIEGDLENRASLDAALDGVYGVYSFPNMSLGIEGEVRQGKQMADAAKVAGVSHFVQGSVGGVERNSGVPHFESKWQIEEYVRELELPATFLRPAFFMENLFWKRDQILAGAYLGLGMSPEKPLQLIAADDIGAFAALAFANPDAYIGVGLELAGDELTEPQMATAFANVIGRPVTLEQPADAQDMQLMVDWFDAHGYEADIADLRSRSPALMDLETWLRNNGWEVGNG
jgi:uncharacterized protein YbjT (DUF2867 family)